MVPMTCGPPAAPSSITRTTTLLGASRAQLRRELTMTPARTSSSTAAAIGASQWEYRRRPRRQHQRAYAATYSACPFDL